MVKVIHVQNDALSAGSAALRLHSAFLKAGIDSSVLSLLTDVNDTEKMSEPGKISRITALLDQQMQSFLFKKADKRFGRFSFPILGTNISKLPQIREAEVIYIHWVQGGFLNLSNYRQLAQLGKPIIIFMHDMWSITGGCHHSFSCEKYKIRCFDCQIFPKNDFVDWPAHEYRKKMKLYSDAGNFYFVSPSRWLYNCARLSNLTKGKPIFHIPNILDSDIFKPIDKKTARHVLNLDPDDTIIAFGAFSVSSPFKGWNELKIALEELRHRERKRKITVLIFGSGNSNMIAEAIPFKSRFFGFVKDVYSMSLIYNAVDIMIAPSLAELFGYVIMESLSCGTPVVAFDVGGIPDLIKHKYNGYLARYRDAEDITEGILFCLDNKIKGSLLPEFERSVVVKKHIDLIKSVLKKENQE